MEVTLPGSGVFYFTGRGLLFIMSKDTFYFSHDYNARSDDKIKRLIRKHGMSGYGIFWTIIEDLYNNANALRADYEGIADDLRADSDIVKSIINDFDLFVFENGSFGSVSIEKRLDERNEKSEKARQSAFKRWDKIKIDANAMRTLCDGNAIKDSIVKDIKENKEEEFKQLSYECDPLKYSVEMVDRFLNYWTEKNKAGKMRYELEKVFEISKRLATWKKNDDKFNKTKKHNHEFTEEDYKN